MSTSSSSSSKICYNSDCTELKSERPRKGWRLRTGEFAELCDRCGIAYEEGRFCDTFHLNASGWRNCESCRKPVHCGCIVSAHTFTLLDPGGIECAACARKNVVLGQNVRWSTPLFFHSPSVKSWSQLAGSGPVPWRQAPTLFNSSASQPEFHPRVSYEVDLSTGIDRIGASERPSFPSLEKRKIESFSERLMNGSLKLGTREILENGHPAEMESFLNAVEGLVILKKPRKKPRKKSNTSNVADKGAAEKEHLSSTFARVLEMQQRPEPLRRGSEEVSEEVAPLQRKKRKVIEPEARGDEVVEFVPRPFPAEVDPEVREREEAEVRGPGKSKELIPPLSFQKSLFEATNITGAKRFLNATLPEVDKRQAREEAVGQLGARVVRHALESASWVNALAQEYAESVKDRVSLQRQCEELQKEKEELQKKNKEMQKKLDEVVPTVTELQNDRDTLSTRLIFEERKRKICEDKIEAQDKYIENMNKEVAELKKNVNLLVHNGMEEHIGNFLNSSTFESIINLYRLPTAILAFTDCRKKVKAQYPEVDVTTVTFGDQEEGVEEDGESLSADFRPLIKLRWERDTEGRTIFPPTFDAELVAVEEVEEVQDAGVEN